MSGCQGILHEHTDSHRAYSTGNRRNVRAERGNIFEINIATQTEAILACGIRNTGGAYIYNSGSRLYHIGCYKSGLSYGCNDNICLQALFLEGLGKL